MCMADSSINVDIDSVEVGEKYRCINCNTKFRGIGKKIRCPTCDSMQVEKDLEE